MIENAIMLGFSAAVVGIICCLIGGGYKLLANTGLWILVIFVLGIYAAIWARDSWMIIFSQAIAAVLFPILEIAAVLTTLCLIVKFWKVYLIGTLVSFIVMVYLTSTHPELFMH